MSSPRRQTRAKMSDALAALAAAPDMPAATGPLPGSKQQLAICQTTGSIGTKRKKVAKQAKTIENASQAVTSGKLKSAKADTGAVGGAICRIN